MRDEEVEYFFAKILVKEKRKKRADVTSSACVEGTKKKKKRRGRGVLKQISERILENQTVMYIQRQSSI